MGHNLTSEPQTLETLQNAFILQDLSILRKNFIYVKKQMFQRLRYFLIRVRFKNEYKQLRYYFPSEINNSTHSNEKTLILKQSVKFKT